MNARLQALLFSYWSKQQLKVVMMNHIDSCISKDFLCHCSNMINLLRFQTLKQFYRLHCVFWFLALAKHVTVATPSHTACRSPGEALPHRRKLEVYWKVPSLSRMLTKPCKTHRFNWEARSSGETWMLIKTEAAQRSSLLVHTLPGEVMLPENHGLWDEFSQCSSAFFSKNRIKSNVKIKNIGI